MEKNLLKNIYLFKGLNESQLEAINKIARLQTFMPEGVIFEQDSTATAFYVIKYGSVRIQQKIKTGESIEITSIATGSHFGEMPFLDDERRSATAVALEKSELVILDYLPLRELLKKSPDIAIHVYRGMAHFLCGRLRSTTNDLSFTREQNVSLF